MRVGTRNDVGVPAVADNGCVTWASGLIRWAMRPTGPMPRPTRRTLFLDSATAVAFALIAAVGAASDAADSDGPGGSGLVHRGGWLGPALLMAAFCAPLALRRRYPLAVLWVVMAGTVVMPSDIMPASTWPRIAFYVCVVAAYSAAAHSPYRAPTLASLAVTAVLVGLAPTVPTHKVPVVYPEAAIRAGTVPYSSLLVQASQPTSIVPTQYVTVLVLVPIVLIANGMRSWWRRAAEDGARLAGAERDRAEAVRHATEQERARIARELHDVVTHSVSMMVIQAGAARTVLTAEPEQATEALLAVEAGGRAALTELRHAMGLLTMSDDADDLTPQPGLDRLPALVDQVRDTGVAVELTVTGDRRRLASGVELTAYRVVQEALTNTVKHAHGASAAVSVDYAEDTVRIEVTDGGGEAAPAATAGTGRGLIGLRERLAVYGGTLHAGPRPTGGWRVAAVILLEPR